MSEALIVFVRKPEKGKVKTRIAAAAGADAALAIYEKLLQHTYDITQPLSCRKYIFYADAIGENDLWSKGSYFKLLQASADLGTRMQQASFHLFQKGYKKVCIIGSDCYELTTAIIQQAYSLLEEKEIVLGPANDGGYYLLAMRDDVKDVFSGIEWSTDKVLQETLEQIKEKDYSYCLLQQLNDVDTVHDVPEEWKINLSITDGTKAYG